MDLAVLCARVGKCRLVLNAKVSHVTEGFFFKFQSSKHRHEPSHPCVDRLVDPYIAKRWFGFGIGINFAKSKVWQWNVCCLPCWCRFAGIWSDHFFQYRSIGGLAVNQSATNGEKFFVAGRFRSFLKMKREPQWMMAQEAVALRSFVHHLFHPFGCLRGAHPCSHGCGWTSRNFGKGRRQRKKWRGSMQMEVYFYGGGWELFQVIIYI